MFQKQNRAQHYCKFFVLLYFIKQSKHGTLFTSYNDKLVIMTN